MTMERTASPFLETILIAPIRRCLAFGKRSIWRDDGLDALVFQESADVVAIIGFVHHGGVQPARLWHSFPNGGEGGGIMALARAQGKGNGGAFIGASGMQFGCPSAAGSSHRLLLLAAAFLGRAG